VRTLLTYVLAALSAIIVDEMVRLATSPTLAAGLGSGDPSLVAGLLAETIVSAFVGFFAILVFAGLIWLMASFALKLIGIRLSGWGLVIQALVIFVLPAALFVLFSTTFLLSDIGLGPQTPDGQLYALQAMGWSFLYFMPPAIAWGSVFWLRQPKRTNVEEVFA